MPTYKVVVTKESTRWYKPDTNILHREDGPAVEDANGNKAWYLNGELHRENGPAVECADGYKEWWLNGALHREDGPAVEYSDGSKSWYLNGECLTEAKWKKAIQPQPSCEGKIVEIDGQKYKLTEV